MKLEKVKETNTWKELANNGRFEEEFNNAIRKCGFYIEPDKLNIEVLDNIIRLTYHSDVKNRDLDSQFIIFNSIEFSKNYNDLVINEASGKLESNYGYDFNNTDGGKLITNYSCRVYDDNGIELSYQSYGDKYLLNKEEFSTYKNELASDVLGKYNPNLFADINKIATYSHPVIVGKDARFLREKRFKDNLGIVEVAKCAFDGDNVVNLQEEYYFNTFYDNTFHSPELIHIMRGFPFATIDNNHRLKVSEDYQKLGLTDNNFQNVARERFLKELKEAREKQIHNDKNIIDKFDVMIEKIEKELGINSKTI